jgi:hypothetical protein
MVIRALLTAITVCGVTTILVGCSSGNIASGLTTDETIGTWTVGDGFDTQLVLAADGTLEATEWPVSLACEEADATDIADLRAADVRDFSGSWQSYGGTLSYQLTLSFDNEVCPEGGTFAYVWRNGDDSLDLCIKISPDVSSDLVRPHQLFVLHREPHGVGGEDSCL